MFKIHPVTGYTVQGCMSGEDDLCSAVANKMRELCDVGFEFSWVRRVPVRSCRFQEAGVRGHRAKGPGCPGFNLQGPRFSARVQFEMRPVQILTWPATLCSPAKRPGSRKSRGHAHTSRCTKGGRALHADDAHSEAKTRYDPHHELDPESGPGFGSQNPDFIVRRAACRVERCRIHGFGFIPGASPPQGQGFGADTQGSGLGTYG